MPTSLCRCSAPEVIHQPASLTCILVPCAAAFCFADSLGQFTLSCCVSACIPAFYSAKPGGRKHKSPLISWCFSRGRDGGGVVWAVVWICLRTCICICTRSSGIYFFRSDAHREMRSLLREIKSTCHRERERERERERGGGGRERERAIWTI